MRWVTLASFILSTGCGATAMRMYEGAPRAQSEVVVVFADIRPDDVWWSGYGDDEARKDDLTVVMSSINGKSVTRQVAADVVVLPPGEHQVSLRVSDVTLVNGQYAKLWSLDQVITVTTEAGRYYYVSGVVDEDLSAMPDQQSTAPPDPSWRPWTPRITDVTHLVEQGKLNGIRTAAGY